MRFPADEGVDRQIVEKLRTEGHDVLYIAEIDAGISDDKVLELSNEEERILMTRDKDFGELAYRDRKVHAGIILNRLYELTSEKKAELVSKVIQEFGEQLVGTFTVIQPGRIRIKKIKLD
jgi:predicted nuclease of predicted toxin-antitoxin system